MITFECLLCRAATPRRDLLCGGCRQQLPRLDAPVCCCGLPCPAAMAVDLCGRCQNDPPAFSAVYSLFRYAWPMDHLIHMYKYRRRLEAERALTSFWPPHPPGTRPDVLVPIPLHRWRRLARGFNQAHRLAQDLGAHWQVPVRPLLKRTRRAHSQQGLDRHARHHNLAGAFACRSDVRNLRILLVDDVVTTAATVREASRCLVEAGAFSVEVLALARTFDE